MAFGTYGIVLTGDEDNEGEDCESESPWARGMIWDSRRRMA